MPKSKLEVINLLEKEIAKLKEKLEVLKKRSFRFSILRLLLFILGVGISSLLYLIEYETIAFSVFLIATVAFLFVMAIHSKIERAIKKFKSYTQIKSELLARAKLDWQNIPKLDKVLIEEPNFIEQDLNLTEEKGFYRLVFTGVSLGGINFLRSWLTGNHSKKNYSDKNHSSEVNLSEVNSSENASDKNLFDEKSLTEEIIIKRQAEIKELKAFTRFRNRLILKTRRAFKDVFVKSNLLEWIENTKEKKGLKQYTFFLSGLSILNLFSFFLMIIGVTQTYYYQILLAYLLSYYLGMRYIRDIEGTSEFLFSEIKNFASVFSFIETYNLGSAKNIEKALSSIRKGENSPSKIFKSLNFASEAISLKANPFVWILIICILPADYLLSLKIESLKKNIKSDFPKWIHTWEKLEALSSLATFAYLNPEYNFAELNSSPNNIEVENVGHPLISYKVNIKNSVKLNNKTEIILITGSNMSGKSTFLRTLGINLLLAYSGSVVCAKKFTTSFFNIFTCIKVSDSITDGISYFYSEVKRLKLILEQMKKTEHTPLVLIDEIYKGTNNVERIIGSKALIKHLAKNNSFALITTHDLELINIAEEITQLGNYHFREIIENGKMTFNYKILKGPCPTTNALRIMEIEGLPTN